MDTSSVPFAICLTIGIVVAVNATLYTMVRRKWLSENIELFRKAVVSARNPWKKEDDDLAQLSHLVSRFKPSGGEGDESADSSST